MNKNVRALLCATALLGSVSTLSVKSEDITVDSGNSYPDSGSINSIKDISSGIVTNNGTINIGADGGLVGVATLNNNYTINNDGTATGGGIVADAIVNSGSITGDGNLTFDGTSSNSGTISQGIINITGVTFDNSVVAGNPSGGVFTANGNFTNAATITGDGTLNINAGGSTAAAITQGNVNVTGTFSNGGALNATTQLTNSGTINTAANITAASLDNQSTISGTGTLSVGGGTNSGTITQANMTTTGDFTNNGSGSIGTDSDRVNLTTTASKTLTNNGTIKAGTFNNYGTTQGSGTLNVTGGTNYSTGVIAMAMTSSDYTNEGSITKAVTNTGTYTNNGDISGVITNNGTQFTNSNTGTITNTINNNTGTFSNSGNIGADGAGVDINNSATFQNNATTGAIVANTITNTTGTFTNGGSLTAATLNNNGGTFTNNVNNTSITTLNNKATIDGTGSLSITGGYNEGTISQAITNSGTFVNRANGDISGAVNNNGTYTNKGSISGVVTNNGTQFTNSNTGTITNTINNNTGTFSNSGNIGAAAAGVDINNSATFQNNATTGAIVANTITNTTGTFTNDGSLTAATLDNNGGTFTNNSTLTATTFNNKSTVNGTGTANISGGQNDAGSSFTQGTLNLTGNYTNNGTITVTNKFTNNSNLTGNGSLSITDVTAAADINDATKLSSNSGTIQQAIVEVAGNKFVNNSTIQTVVDAADTTGTTGAFTNRATELVNNSIITADGTFTNTGKISGNSGTLNINAGGSTTRDITQANVNITTTGTQTFDNGGVLTAANLTNSGTINNTSNIIADTITNNSGALISDGNITIGSGSNAGTINVAIANLTGDLTNTNNLTATTLQGSGSILRTGGVGEGSVEIGDGSGFTGSINQKSVTINDTLSITNGQTLVAEDTLTIADNATLTNTDSSVTAGNISGNGTIALKDNASLTATSQTNPLTNWIRSLKNTTATDPVKNTIDVNGNIAGKVSVEDGTTLELTKGNILGDTTNDARVEVTNGGTLDLKGTSTAVINTNDTWAKTVTAGDGTVTKGGTITLNGGNLTVKDRTTNGALIANTGAVTLESGTLDITGGSVIKDAVTTELQHGTTLNILEGGKVTLNTGDTWAQDIKDTDGNVTTKGATIILGETGTTPDVKSVAELQTIINDVNNNNALSEDLTMLNVKGLNSTGTLKANNGVLLLGDKNLDIHGESYIATAVAMELGGNINVSNGGKVAIDDNDKMSGSNPTVTLSEGGTLNYGKTVDSGLKIVADAGNLNLLGNDDKTKAAYLTFNSGNIADAVAIDIQKNATLKVDGSTLNLDNKDKWDGNIINTNGIVNANNISRSETATLQQSGGELNLFNNTDLALGSESSITKGKINIKKDHTTVNPETGATKDIVGTAGSKLTITSGYDATSQVIKGGDMTIDKYSEFNVNAGTFTLDSLNAYGETDTDGTVRAALVNTMNGERTTSVIKNFNTNSDIASDNIVNFNIDVHARNINKNSIDQFEIGTMGKNGAVRIDKWALNGDIYGYDAPVDRIITLDNIFMDKNGDPILNANIEVTDQETFTPIGWYRLHKNDTYEDILDASGAVTGQKLVGTNYSLNLSRFNPQVFRGQVATVAQWMNQLAIDDMLFNHTMLIPSFKEESGNKPSNAMANQYSAINPLFSPYQYSVKDGGLWYKMYGTFEHLNMNQGLGRVGNNSYGSLIGADFGLKNLENGWKFMPTAFIGYNGAHQYWSGVGQYQNGGQAGFMGTWYKDNFIVSGVAYGGIYDNSMNVFGHNDNTFNYFAGTAAKAAYNWRFRKNWILQPNLMASYNYFGKQTWHSDFGQMSMRADMLHGVNIAPGVNLIWEKETFSTYLTLQYLYNVNGACGGKAGNVGLPQIEMDRGYIQYGIGFTKKFTDRASGYLQAVFRNVGRTGVGFQAGFNFKLGK